MVAAVIENKFAILMRDPCGDIKEAFRNGDLKKRSLGWIKRFSVNSIEP